MKWNKILHDSYGIEKCWDVFKNILFIKIDKNIPKINIKSEFQTDPWFDSETFELCRKKDRLHAKYKASKKDPKKDSTKILKDYMKFSNCRRDLKHMVNQKMKDNFTTESEPDSISKKFWSFVKAANKSHRIPNSVNYEGCHRTDNKEQAELFNKFFYDQFSDESSYDITIDSTPTNSSRFEIKFDNMEICNLLRRINPNKAHGPDGIPGRILKNCALTISTPLAILFDASYKSSQLPNDSKLANVVPIHKNLRIVSKITALFHWPVLLWNNLKKLLGSK